MNAVLERILTTRTVERPSGGRIALEGVSVTAATGRALYDFLREERPERTLEIGLAYGLSALFICQAHRDNGAEAEHTAIDPAECAMWDGIGLRNIERAGFNRRFRFIEARSDEALPRLCAGEERFDFAFVDGSHLFDNAFVDFFYIDKMLGVGGHVAFDDLWMPAVRRVASFALRNRGYRLVSRPASGGPAWKQALRMARRFVQDPLGPDLALKLTASNVGFLQKTREDDRSWSFHRRF